MDYTQQADNSRFDDNGELGREQESTTNAPTKEHVIIAVVAFILGLGVGFIVSDGNPPQDTAENINANPAATTEENQIDNGLATATTTGITASDQPAGDSVSVSDAIIDQSGWVAVYEDVDGQPGSILGAQRIDTGEWSGDVQLLRATEPNSFYYVKLLSDNGDDEFNHEDDLPLENAAGEDIQTTFQTYSSSPRGESDREG